MSSSDMWSANSGGAGEDPSNFGKNRFAEKKELIDENKGDDVDLSELAGGFVRSIKSQAKKFQDAVTPAFYVRYQNVKVHSKHIVKIEKEVEELKDMSRQSIEEARNEAAKEKVRTARLKLKFKEIADHKEESHKFIEAFKQVEKKKEVEDYKIRRNAQLVEVQAQIDSEAAEIKAKMEKDQEDLQKWRMNFWKKTSKENHEEAVVWNKKLYEDKLASNLAVVDDTYLDWKEREVSRARMQVEGPSLSIPSVLGSGKTLGIFGTPYGDGEFKDFSVESGHIHQEGLDDYYAHLFDVNPPMAYEEENINYMELASEISRKQQLYEALLAEQKNMNYALERMREVKGLAEVDRKQLQNEILVTERDQEGPPRRDPYQPELLPMHIRKQQISIITQRLGELEYSMDKSQINKEVIDSQLVKLAQDLSVLREKETGVKGGLDSINNGMGQLPIVIGRSISKIKGINPLLAKPKELMNAVRMKSQWYEMKGQEQTALKYHRERIRWDQVLWLEKQKGSDTKAEYDIIFSKLMEISGKLKTIGSDNDKLNLVDAVKCFLASKTPLKTVKFKIQGVIPWFKYCERDDSEAVMRYSTKNPTGCTMFEDESVFEQMNSNPKKQKKLYKADDLSMGITLADDEKQGHCCGLVNLPKDTLWCIVFVISPQGNGPEYENLDETDSVTVRFGPSINSVSSIGTFYNKINPETGTVIHDIKYIYRGNVLAFKFEFSSSKTEGKRHLAVGPGLFEEYEVKALEVKKDPVTGKEKLISSHVQTIRDEEKAGKHKHTRFIEELVESEESNLTYKNDKQYWDSDIITTYKQRFSKDLFLRLLRAEILIFLQGMGDQLKKDKKIMKERSKEKKVSDNAKEQRYFDSIDAYIGRKRLKQVAIVAAGQAKVGKIVELHEPEKNVWKHCVVERCILKWVENGIRAKITHRLQEYDELMYKVGSPFDVDLTEHRYYETPQQELDETQLENLREQRASEQRLLEIDEMTKKKTTEMREQFIKFKNTEEGAYKHHVKHATRRIERQGVKEAVVAVQQPMSRRAVAASAAKVLREMKRGVIPTPEELDTEDKLRIHAEGIAKQRFVDDWINKRKENLAKEFAEKDLEVRKRLLERWNIFERYKQALFLQSRAEVYNLRALLAERRAAEVELVKARVKLKPDLLKLALPKPFECEHLKTKAWGQKYAKGIRCVFCGKELASLFKEESQFLGYGSAWNAEVSEAFNRHRMNEQAFKFKNSAQLHVIESERHRIEKDRREIDQSTSYFYDYDDLRAIYVFDHRHQMYLKDAGTFRQGVQWRQEDVENYQAKRVQEKIQELTAAGLVVEEHIANYDPLDEVLDPAPTFRADDMKRRAQYYEMMFMMGRLNTFRKKIMALKDRRLELLGERSIYSSVLESLHKDSFTFDSILSSLEKDLDKTALLIATFEKMERLWKAAKRITAQALKEKRKCDLKLAGLWDDVKELKEGLHFLHDETRSLIKVKFMLESKVEHCTKMLEDRRALFEKAKAAKLEVEDDALSMQYCVPGMPVVTRYGNGTIRIYRHKDRMLMVSLSFGSPPAKLWIHLSEIVNTDRCKQKAEVFIMEQEDESMKKFYHDERIKLMRERTAMGKEEVGLREFFEFQDMAKLEEGLVKEGLNKMVAERFAITRKAKYHNTMFAKAVGIAEKQQEDLLKASKEYKGPPSGRPKPMNMWEFHKLKKDILHELSTAWITKAALQNESFIKQDLHKRRQEFYQNTLFKILIDQTVDEVIVEVAGEAYREGKYAKIASEKQSGIYFPNPPGMQFSPYSSLSKLWKLRKEELRKAIEINKGTASKGDKKMNSNKSQELSNEEIQRLKEAKKKAKTEKKRQEAMCAEMAREEERCKTFYLWELQQNLRERRQMRENESEMKKLLKEEAKAAKAAKSAYAVAASIAAMNAKQTVTNDAEKRREELKAITLERRRREEDQAFMTLEDEFGALLREIDIAERSRAKFLKEFGDVQLPGQGVNEDADEQPTQQSAAFCKLPVWMKKPREWEKWDINRQRKEVNLMTKIRMKQKNIDMNVIKDEMRYQKLENKSYSAWLTTNSVFSQKYMEADLSEMQMEEDAKAAEAEIYDLRENIKKILVFCREKGEEELTKKSILRKREILANKRTMELKEAQAWLDLCERRAKTREKLKRKVTEDCKFVDTTAVCGFHQRFKTELLRQRLYLEYFTKIIYGVVNRAETIATERFMMGIQERLSQNRDAILFRTRGMKKLWKEYQREEHMRMRRSFLNTKFFPKNRFDILKEKFSGWVRYFYWNRGHREAFEMKYEMIRNQLLIDRQYKEQLIKEKGEEEAKPSFEQKREVEVNTLLQAHKERPIQCKQCLSFYFEAQNNSMACVYHPFKFITACPASCPNPGLTPLCIAHRTRRWKCCDSTNPAVMGCSRRFHIQTGADPVYDKIMEKINERDGAMLQNITKNYDKAMREKWPEKLQTEKRRIINKLEDNVQDQRDTIARHKDIKWQ